jgi:hypothetical protein
MKYILLFLLTLTLSGCVGLQIMIAEQEKAEARCHERGGKWDMHELHCEEKDYPTKLPAKHPSGAVENSEKWVVDKRDCDILTAPVKEYGVAHCMYMKGWREQRK